MPVDEVLEHFGTRPEGLAGDDAARRLEHHGPNRLPEAEPDPLWLRLARHFQDVLIYILLVAALLKAVLGEWVDFGVILAAPLPLSNWAITVAASAAIFLVMEMTKRVISER
jgi:magnesium-transporting ATPase (P-type)